MPGANGAGPGIPGSQAVDLAALGQQGPQAFPLGERSFYVNDGRVVANNDLTVTLILQQHVRVAEGEGLVAPVVINMPVGLWLALAEQAVPSAEFSLRASMEHMRKATARIAVLKGQAVGSDGEAVPPGEAGAG